MKAIISAIGMWVISFVLTVASATAGTRLAVPVMVGERPNEDACGGLGRVFGLSSTGDGFLAVRSGPGNNYPMLDRLRNGDDVFLCDESKGEWIGIVYPADRRDCRTGRILPKKKAYSGPCKAGWVFGKWIESMAG